MRNYIQENRFKKEDVILENNDSSSIREIMENIYIKKYLSKDMENLFLNKKYHKVWFLITKYNNHEDFYYALNDFKDKNEKLLTTDNENNTSLHKIQDYCLLSCINTGSNFIEIKEKYNTIDVRIKYDNKKCTHKFK